MDGRLGTARHGLARPGRARQARHGRGRARLGPARFGRRGKARHGTAWLDTAGITTEPDMTIKSELLAIQSASNDGILHCHKAVEWARANPGSALHSAIEWDDEKAAGAYRLWTVRHLIELHIKSASDGPTVVSLTIDRKAGGGYRAVSDVIAVPDLRAIMLQDALDELERVQAKYARVEALASVWEAAEEVRQRLGVKRRKAA